MGPNLRLYHRVLNQLCQSLPGDDKRVTRQRNMALVILVSAVTLAISGFLFRGLGMDLDAPWSMPDGYNP